MGRCAQPDSAGEARTIAPHADAHQSLAVSFIAISITWPLLIRLTNFWMEILAMVNRAYPVPRNVLSVVRTGWNKNFTDLHCEAGDSHLGIRQRYLRPGS